MSIEQHFHAVPGGQLPLTVVRAGGAGAAVVIVPSAFGIGPDLQEQMTELAADASLVVAFDPFFRDDPGPATYDDMGRALARVRSVDRARTYDDLSIAIGWLREEVPGAPVILLGICFGGPYALLAAADGLVDGAVTWHGTRMEEHVDRTGEMRCPLRLHFGSEDPIVPPAAVEAIREALSDLRQAHIVVHAGATHGFSHRSATAYDERAERAGMASLRELVSAAP